MNIKVEVLQKDKSGIERHRTIELNQDFCLIGRGSSDIVLFDPKCSLHHVILFEDEKGHLNLVDLRSTNGTQLNGKRVVKAITRVGDSIKVGDSNLKLLQYLPKRIAENRNSDLTKWEYLLVSSKEELN